MRSSICKIWVGHTFWCRWRCWCFKQIYESLISTLKSVIDLVLWLQDAELHTRMYTQVEIWKRCWLNTAYRQICALVVRIKKIVPWMGQVEVPMKFHGLSILNLSHCLHLVWSDIRIHSHQLEMSTSTDLRAQALCHDRCIFLKRTCHTKVAAVFP